MKDDLLCGRVCLVTGANGGIGFEVARGLADHSATVLLACRNRERGEAAVAAIRAATGNAEVELELADLSLQRSVRELARSVCTRQPRLDLLVNNAGVWPAERQLTAEGVELTWATNVLGPFLLTSLLGELLRASAPARVVNLGSIAAGGLDLTDVEFARRRFVPVRAYAQSKQAIHMLTWSFAERLRAAGVTANAVHPGAVATGLFQRRRSALGSFLDWGLNLVGRSAARGADTIVWLGSDPTGLRETGKLWHDRRPIRSGRREPARLGELWRTCEAMCGERQPSDAEPLSRSASAADGP